MKLQLHNHELGNQKHDDDDDDDQKHEYEYGLEFENCFYSLFKAKTTFAYTQAQIVNFKPLKYE